jgi:hypothetical protein
MCPLETPEVNVSITSAGRDMGRDSKYLGLRIGPSRSDDAHGEQEHCGNLDPRVFLAIQTPCDHGCDAASRPQDDVHWNRDVVAEGVVVEHVDAEKQHNVDEPSADRDAVRLEEKGRTLRIELRWQPDGGDKGELDKGQERSCW